MPTPSAPLVSVLLPAFNAASTLPQCVRSIQRQTETRWECVIVDDGSTDATGADARRLAADDSRFTVVSIAHQGLVGALNTGIEHCRGQFVARMDADDVMHRQRLALQLAMLEHAPTLAAVGCHVRIFPRAGLREGRRDYERWLNGIDTARRVREDAFVECPLVHPTLVIRRDVLAALGYRDCGWPEDYDLVLRLLARHEIGMVPRRLLSWRDSPTRLSRTSATYSLTALTACRAQFLAEQFLADADSYILWGYGETARALRRALLAHGKRPTYIVEVHRGRLGNVIHGAPVIVPERLAELPRQRIIASVAGPEPRRQIREALTAMGFAELRDFVCAA